MSDQPEPDHVEHYIVRLLDECRSEIQLSDSKASILFAAVATAAAILANVLIDNSSALRTSGAFVVTLSMLAAASFLVSMAMLGLCVTQRVGQPEAGKAGTSRNMRCSPPIRSSSLWSRRMPESPAIVTPTSS